MIPRPRVWIGVSLSGMLLGMTALAWVLTATPSVQTWRLADGSTVAVEGITYGRQRRFIFGSRWQKLLLLFLPADVSKQFQRRFNCRVEADRRPGGNSVVVWTAFHKVARTR